MPVRRLRKKQIGPWCSYCDARAVYTSGHQKHSCTEHLTELEAFNSRECQMNSYQTEGEWQALGSRW